MTRDEVHEVFALLLAREPVSGEAVRDCISNDKSVSKLVERILASGEFRAPACEERLEARPLTEDLVVRAYRLILDREPAGPEAVAKHLASQQSQRQLIDKLTKTKEYRRKTKRLKDIKQLVASEGFNLNPRVIYLHIPKTAGKSFERLARDNYGDGCSLSTSGDIHWHEWQAARLVGGHFFYSAYDKMKGRRVFLALVRDPVERAISRFNFYRNKEGGYERRVKQGFDHNDMKAVIRASRYRVEFADNYQCRYLSRGNSFRSVRRAFRRDAFIVGHFDQIEEWIAVLGSRLGWTDLKLPEINKAAASNYMAEYFKDDALVSLLRKRNREDYKLLDFIRQQGVYESQGAGFDYTDFSCVPGMGRT